MIRKIEIPLVTTVKERCRVCYTCVRECPAKAIRIADGQAEVLGERCIGCGNCVRVCSQHAKLVRCSIDAVESLLAGEGRVAACLAPSFPAEFSDFDWRRLPPMLRRLGFDLVTEVAFGADLVADEYRRLLARPGRKRYIATSCPAIVSYVERYHPDMVDNLAPIVSPMVAQDRELRHALDRLKEPPSLVVTDSQAFLKVAADTPLDVPMTSFSILMARFKGDLPAMVAGAVAIESLRTGDRVLIAEACSHHPIGEDIGRVKIPRWLAQYVGGPLEIQTIQGHDFPEDLRRFRLVIHCGACMWNRREMLSRIARCRQAGVAIANYGLAIAYALGIFDRALEPFPAVRLCLEKTGH